MSQFGMQMPGGRARRGLNVDVYLALLGLAVVFLIAANVIVFGAASKLGKDGNPFGLQEAGEISIKGVEAARGR